MSKPKVRFLVNFIKDVYGINNPNEIHSHIVKEYEGFDTLTINEVQKWM